MMTTLRFWTIWDLPSFSRRQENTAKADESPATVSFLTTWDEPYSRRGKVASGDQAQRKQVVFFP